MTSIMNSCKEIRLFSNILLVLDKTILQLSFHKLNVQSLIKLTVKLIHRPVNCAPAYMAT